MDDLYKKLYNATPEQLEAWSKVVKEVTEEILNMRWEDE